jgi:hypothetical protein
MERQFAAPPTTAGPVRNGPNGQSIVCGTGDTVAVARVVFGGRGDDDEDVAATKNRPPPRNPAPVRMVSATRVRPS